MQTYTTREEALEAASRINDENYFDHKPNTSFPLTGVWSKSSLHYAGHNLHRWAAGLPKKITHAMGRGTLLDVLLTEPEKFQELYVVTSEEDARKKAYKDAKAAAESSGRRLVKESEVKAAQDACDAIMNHHLAKEMLSGDMQHIMTGAVKLSGSKGDVFLSLKGKTDATIIGDGTAKIWDLKGTGAEDDESIKRISKQVGYHWQEFLYSKLSEQNGLFCESFKFAFVEFDAPHRVRVVEFGDEALDAAEKAMQKVFSAIYAIGHGASPYELESEKLLLGGGKQGDYNYWDTVPFTPSELVDVEW